MPFLSWVGNVPGGAAGGALTGTYPNPTLAVPVQLQVATGTSPVFGAGVTGDTNNRVELRGNGTIALGPGNVVPGQTISRIAGPAVASSAQFDINTIGNGLSIAEGTNAKQGTAVLTAGSVVVANTSVTANSRIQLTSNADGGTPGFVRVSARTAGTSFTITSSSGTDTSTIAYLITEPG